MRDGMQLDFGAAAVRQVRVAIIGGGPAGLAAGYALAKRGIDAELFELEDREGGTSGQGESAVTRFPLGAHYLPLPMAHDEPLIALLREMGAIAGVDEHGDPIGAEELLVAEPEERLFYRGWWYDGVYPQAGASPRDLDELARFKALVDRYASMRDGRGRRAFATPIAMGSDDPEIVALERTPALDWLAEHDLRGARLRFWLEYATRDDYGLSLADSSAWALLFYHAARTPRAGVEARPFLTWPEGNGALASHLARRCARISRGHVVVRVVQASDRVQVDALDVMHERPVRIVAERAIVATPRFVAERIVPGLPRAGFSYGAWLVANLSLRGRPASRGVPDAWDNVLYDSPSVGYVSATHQRGRSYGPTHWTYYLPFTDSDPRISRERMLSATFDDVREAIVRDLGRAHPDLAMHLTRVDATRWAHAMIRPNIGAVFGEERRRAREPMGAIHFAHSDLSGVALFEEAFSHGVRAAGEVATALG